MKQNSKTNKIYLVFIALALLFLLAVNSTYAYFSATSGLDGSMDFATLSVEWYGGESGSLESSDGTIEVTPSSLAISRGGEFGLKYGGTEQDFGFNVLGAPVYIRFYVDAFVEGDETNYGKYFQLQFNDNAEYWISSVERDSVDNIVYYYDDTLGARDSGAESTTLISAIKFLEDAPAELLETTITLTLHFDAVQAENEAYLSVFDDDYGYSQYWE